MFLEGCAVEGDEASIVYAQLAKININFEDMEKKKIPFKKDIPIGVMIEVPSAAINADILARHSDFFSVGTNDLVQYVLAVDRISEKIAYLYNPLNISVLRLLKHIVDVSDKFSVPLSICGEMAGEPKYTMLLLGLGYRHFSMSSTYMYQVKRIIRSVKIRDCKKLVKDIMSLEDISDIEVKVNRVINKEFPWLSI